MTSLSAANSANAANNVNFPMRLVQEIVVSNKRFQDMIAGHLKTVKFLYIKFIK